MKLMMSRLMGMMFIQYIVQGAWVLTLGLVLSSYGMPDIIGTAYAVLGIATILSPMFVGMVADRFFSTEKLLGIMHLLLAAVLYITSGFIVAGQPTYSLIGIFFVHPDCRHPFPYGNQAVVCPVERGKGDVFPVLEYAYVYSPYGAKSRSQSGPPPENASCRAAEPCASFWLFIIETACWSELSSWAPGLPA